MKQKLNSFIFFFGVLYFTFARAQVNYEEVEIDLFTFGVGEHYWEAFGHSALRVKINEIDYMYGFGYFDFNDEDFFLKFAKGEMRYFLGVEKSLSEIESYKRQGRAIWSQKLKLNSQQKQQLLTLLTSLSQENNRYYQYDYFLNNCTSKIRDLLDEVTNGDLSSQLKGDALNKSWSDLTFPVKNQSWMNLGIAIAYGIPAYIKRDKWSLSVFPKQFANDLKGMKVDSNLRSKLMQREFAHNDSVQYSIVYTHYVLFSLVTLLLIGLLVPFTFKFTAYSWLLIQSCIGVSLLFLWFLSKHSVASWNINILLFVPFAFLLLKKTWLKYLILIFFIFNLIWLVLAMSLTSVYLIGFAFINLIIIMKLKRYFKK